MIPSAGLDGLVEGIRNDLRALQAAGVDAVMFGNENDRPYEFKVDTASTAAMAYAIGQVKREITVPFGVNVLWDPMSSVALAAATGASFIREILTGTYASDMGPWNPDAGAAMRYIGDAGTIAFDPREVVQLLLVGDRLDLTRRARRRAVAGRARAARWCGRSCRAAACRDRRSGRSSSPSIASRYSPSFSCTPTAFAGERDNSSSFSPRSTRAMR